MWDILPSTDSDSDSYTSVIAATIYLLKYNFTLKTHDVLIKHTVLDSLL